jgi:transposase
MIPANARVLLAVEPCDMRRWIGGLRKRVAERFGEDATSSMYVFANGKRDRVKILWHTPTGWLVLYKQLDQRRVRLPAVAHGARSVVIDRRTLALLLDGVPARGARPTSRELAREARRKVDLSTTKSRPHA